MMSTLSSKKVDILIYGFIYLHGSGNIPCDSWSSPASSQQTLWDWTVEKKADRETHYALISEEHTNNETVKNEP